MLQPSSSKFAVRLASSHGAYVLLSRFLAKKVAPSASAHRLAPAIAIAAVRALLSDSSTQAARTLLLLDATTTTRPPTKADAGRVAVRLIEQGQLVLFKSVNPIPAPIECPRTGTPAGSSCIPQPAEANRDATTRVSAASREGASPRPNQNEPEEGPQVLGFRWVDRPGRDGLFKSINSKNPSRHGYVFEYGRNAADFRHAKDCERCGAQREVRIQGDVLDGKCGADAVLADGTLVQRKSYRRLSGLRAAILRQVASDLRRYGCHEDPERRWKSGRNGIPLNGAIEFQIDLDRLLRRPAPPESAMQDGPRVVFPAYSPNYISAWCAELEQEIRVRFSPAVNGKRPNISIKALRAGQRFCPFATETAESST